MSLSAILRKKRNRPASVVRSDEFRRILALPRRSSYEDLTLAMTEWLRVDDGTQFLRPVQAWALAEIFEQKGALISATVGAGKTIIAHEAPVVLEAERPLLLVKAALRDKAERDRVELAKQWRQHPNLRILSYEMLSSVNYSNYLFEFYPDLIIADESQHIKNLSKGRGKRVKHYFEERPETMFISLTGSLTNKSIHEYADHAKWALKNNSPLPRSYMDLNDWADVLDVDVAPDAQIDPGALREFCNPGEEVRHGYRRRFVETKGVITTEDADLEIGLILKERKIEVPQVVIDAFDKLANDWETPGEEKVGTTLDWIRHAKELICGFYYKWIWPNNKVDVEWKEARKAWRKFVHQTIIRTRSKSFETEKQVKLAVERGDIECPANEYQNWFSIHKRVEPKTEAVWISDYMLNAVQHWVQNPPTNEEGEVLHGIAWIEHVCFMEKLKERGVLCFGAGENEIEQCETSCAASIHAHGTGKNLQYHHSRSLLVTCPEYSQKMEQVIGRMHRMHQKQPEVTYEVYLPCRQLWHCLEKVRRQAEYIQATTGQQQRIQIATQDITTNEAYVLNRWQQRDPLWLGYEDGG